MVSGHSGALATGSWHRPSHISGIQGELQCHPTNVLHVSAAWCCWCLAIGQTEHNRVALLKGKDAKALSAGIIL